MARAESAFFECPGGLHYPGALGPFGYYNFNWMHMHSHGSFASLPLIWYLLPSNKSLDLYTLQSRLDQIRHTFRLSSCTAKLSLGIALGTGNSPGTPHS